MPAMHMPQRTRPFRVATTLGHTFIFNPGESLAVPDDCVAICMQHGAIPVDPEALNALEAREESKKKRELTPEQRRAAMEAKFAEMLAEPERFREAYTAAGRPHVGWLATALGLDRLNYVEVNAVWTDFLAAQRESAA